MSANNAASKNLTIEAKNAGAGSANVAMKAKSVIQLGDAATYSSAFIQAQHFLVFQQAAGLSVEAGETLAQGDAVVAKWDAGASKVRFFKAANNAGSDVERNVHGLAQNPAAAAGDKFQLGSVPGVQVATGLTGLTSSDIGKPLFLGTGGALSVTAPTTSGTSVFRAGFVLSHNGGPGGKAIALFQPQFIAKIF